MIRKIKTRRFESRCFLRLIKRLDEKRRFFHFTTWLSQDYKCYNWIVIQTQFMSSVLASRLFFRVPFEFWQIKKDFGGKCCGNFVAFNSFLLQNFPQSLAHLLGMRPMMLISMPKIWTLLSTVLNEIRCTVLWLHMYCGWLADVFCLFISLSRDSNHIFFF